MWKKKKFLTMEEQVAKLSSKCRELTEEESRILNGGGHSVWDSYDGSGCPYEYTTVPEETTEETSSQITSTPANKTPKLPESSAMDVTNQTEQDVEKATESESNNTQGFSHSSGNVTSSSNNILEKTNPIYYDRVCDAAMLAEYRGTVEEEKVNTGKSVWDYYNKAGCPYKYTVAPNLFNQHQFTKDYGFYDEDGKRFEDTACNATAAVNIFSMQYTKETGKKLTFEDAVAALKNAIEKEKIDYKDATVNDLAPAINEMIKYVESKNESQNIFEGYFGYKSKTWMKSNYSMNPDNIQITESYQIDINKGRTVPKHYTNDFGTSVIGDDYRVIFDTYDGNIKAKEIIDTRKTNYFSIIKKDY